jgi:hypothetical protein
MVMASASHGFLTGTAQCAALIAPYGLHINRSIKLATADARLPVPARIRVMPD